MIVAHAAMTKTDLAVKLVIVDPLLVRAAIPLENAFSSSARQTVIGLSSNVRTIALRDECDIAT